MLSMSLSSHLSLKFRALSAALADGWNVQACLKYWDSKVLYSQYLIAV